MSGWQQTKNLTQKEYLHCFKPHHLKPHLIQFDLICQNNVGEIFWGWNQKDHI